MQPVQFQIMIFGNKWKLGKVEKISFSFKFKKKQKTVVIADENI